MIGNWRSVVWSANSSGSDMYQSISHTIAKIEKQARRLKNKIIDKSHKAIKVREFVDDTSEVAPEPDTPRIRHVRRYAVKPMTAEEAAISLKDEKNQFLVFRNAEIQRISVIYRRGDGDYGLIEP